MVAEVVSNRYLAGSECLSGEDEGRLVELGWEPPNPPDRPNWIVVEPTISPQTASTASQVAATLKEVFNLADEDDVVVRLFSSPLRGNTPASALAG
jgi:type III secretion system-like peptide-binding chaperone